MEVNDVLNPEDLIVQEMLPEDEEPVEPYRPLTAFHRIGEVISELSVSRGLLLRRMQKVRQNFNFQTLIHETKPATDLRLGVCYMYANALCVPVYLLLLDPRFSVDKFRRADALFLQSCGDLLSLLIQSEGRRLRIWAEVLSQQLDAMVNAVPYAPDFLGDISPPARLKIVRLREVMTIRTLVREFHWDNSTPMVRKEEVGNNYLKLPLSRLYEWQRVLKVPIEYLFLDLDWRTEVRVQLLKILRTLKSMEDCLVVSERSERILDRICVMRESICRLAPHLPFDFAWPSVGQRRSLDDLGRAAEWMHTEDESILSQVSMD